MRVDEMPAGREMNALIAEKAMGWTVFYGEYKGYELFDDEVAQGYPPKEEADGVPFEIPYYSTDIAAAWEVVEILGKHGYTAHIEWKGSNRVYAATAEVTFVKCIYTEGHGVGALPEAICRAAFKAVMGRE